MKSIGISIAVFFIFTLPATSMALTIHGDGLTFQATANDIPVDKLLNIISEMTVMRVSMRGDIHDLNTTDVVDFFETMATGRATGGFDFGPTAGRFGNAPAAPGNGLHSLRNTGAAATDVTAAMPEPASMSLLMAGLLSLVFIGDRIMRE